MDLGHGSLHDAVFTHALAVFYDTADHKERDRKLEMDIYCTGNPHTGGHGPVLYRGTDGVSVYVKRLYSRPEAMHSNRKAANVRQH